MIFYANKQHEEDKEECVVVDRRQYYPNRQEYHAIVKRGQVTTPKYESRNEEMSSIDFRTVVLEQIAKKKKKKDKMAYLISNDNKLMEQQRQNSDEIDDRPRNFVNCRRRVVDVSDAKTCALLMAKIKEAAQSSQ
ncbi:hypothetical protein LOAG_10817 [Loa loa]|uniref:Uncharacterized protein n=1 Tax=Loa loa TaxID=7209 RepID=A0A1S0TQC0_LOALO|nr:hypothetical protein LOAG_10817 [Loa loa]EFO17682.2 hypothetical protein LOAG_10817 [Loa loa]